MKQRKNLKMVFCLMMTVILLSANGMFVSAKESGVIVLNDISEINLYHGADGVYVDYLPDGSFIRATISTTKISQSDSGTYATRESIQNKSYNYEYMRPNGVDLDWSSEVVGTFHFDNTYVWCTAGTAYKSFGKPSSSSISYSKNTYSSAKVTGVSKYEVAAKIVTPTGTYNINQFIGSNPKGEASVNMSF